MSRSTRCVGGFAIALCAVSFAPRLAQAQVPTVSPGGGLADPAAPPPTSQPAPRQAPPPTIIVTPEGQGTVLQSEGGDDGSGYYHMDGYQGGDEDGVYYEDDAGSGIRVHGGAAPTVHKVQSGDTLWDISSNYFSNPWEWPRVWSYNPEITNPHWIYPGDQVRLRKDGELLATDTGEEEAPENGDGDAGERAAPLAASRQAPPTDSAIELRQLGFLAREDLEAAIVIQGSPEEKLLLSVGDEVYLSYPKDKPPKVGQNLTVYREKKRVKHPSTGDEVGAYVQIVGEVEVISVKKDKFAHAVVLDSVDAMERGMKAGPLVRQFKNVEKAAAAANVEGTIIADLGADELIGARQIVFIDRGKNHGLAVGNELVVVRRGDAYAKIMGPKTNIGKNDPKYPARSIGVVRVIQVAANSSVAVVVRSEHEFSVGDRVVMTKSR